MTVRLANEEFQVQPRTPDFRIQVHPPLTFGGEFSVYGFSDFTGREFKHFWGEQILITHRKYDIHSLRGKSHLQLPRNPFISLCLGVSAGRVRDETNEQTQI